MLSKKSSFPVHVCFVVFLLIYSFTSRADLQVSDEIEVFTSAVSLATKDTLAIDFLEWTLPMAGGGPHGPDGHLYSKYFPGNIMGAALLYRITEKENDKPYIWHEYFPPFTGHILAASNTGARIAMRWNALLGAVAMGMLYAFLQRHFDWKTTATTVLIFGLCTDWWYQTRGLYSEIGAGTLLLLSLYFADSGSPLLSSISLGLSILFRPTNLVGIPIWLYSLWKKGFRYVWTGIFIVIGLCVLLFYNWLRFRSLFDFGYTDEHFNSWIIEGLVGIFFSPGRSLFFYSPVLILTISGVQMFYKRNKILTLSIVSTVMAQILLIATWHSWEGGESWGSRLVAPVLPLLGIFIAPVIEKALFSTSPKAKNAVVLLVVIGFGIQLLTLTQNPFVTMVHYVGSGRIPYSDTINSFQNSWLSLQIRNLENWNLCNVDAYSIRQWLVQCK